ncbi:hypothetical protein WJX72_012043 [[Myrmecia] bisecta]|uniref:Rad60/SUMO-like domain-containing protein n=1 Tax=[Myrmecia] bisecta TaxID=41462 RepID=A0AAW1QTQ8_9CHLO
MAEEKPNTINLKVKDQTGTEVQFKVKWDTPLQKVFNAYAYMLHQGGSRPRPAQVHGGWCLAEQRSDTPRTGPGRWRRDRCHDDAAGWLWVLPLKRRASAP